MTSKRRTKAPPDERTGTTTPLEWVVAVLGLCVVLAALSVLLHQALTRGNGPPAIVTSVVDVTRAGEAYVVEVLVENRGARTAAELKIEGSLGADETSDTTIDYLPPKSTRPIGLLFTKDPRSTRLTIRAVSFTDP